jgi:hypothetical protein
VIKTPAIVVACLVVGAAIGTNVPRWLGISDGPAVPPVSSVDAEWLEQLRPERRGGLWDRMTTTPIAPVATQTAPPTAAGRRRVAAYCAPAVVPVLVGPRLGLEQKPDVGISTPENRGVLPDFGARSARHRLELYSTLSDGSGWRREYRPPSARWSLATDADSTWLVTERWLPRATRSAGRCAIAGAAGLLLGLAVDRPAGAALLACSATFLPH